MDKVPLEVHTCIVHVCSRAMHNANNKLQVALLISLASTTAGVALLAPLTSYCPATQCLSIIEVIKLSG